MNTLEKILSRNDLLFVDNKIGNINRTKMARILGDLGFRKGAEIGVAEGMHAKVLCENNIGVELYLIDAYKNYEGYDEYSGKLNECRDQAVNAVGRFNTHFIEKFSMDAVKDFEDNSLDFVYIDGGHDFKNISMDLCEWSKKVRVGGIVFGHDYKRSKRRPVHVKDVFDAYAYSHEIKPWFVLTNDIKDPTFGHDNPGFMFIRQETDKL